MSAVKLPLARMTAVKSIGHDQTETKKVKIPVRIKTKDNIESHLKSIVQVKPKDSIPTNQDVMTQKQQQQRQQQPQQKFPYNAPLVESKDNATTSNNQPLYILQNLLLISEGRDILAADRSPWKSCNLYCISRVFWSKEIGRTSICWNTNHPCFHFQEVG